jgi:hypothetical protein
MDQKQKEGAQILGLAGVLAIGMLLARRKPMTATTAGVTIAVLDQEGNEVLHNSPVDLEAGESYTVEIRVTNQSTLQGQPVAAALTSSIGIMVVGEPSLISDTRTDNFPAGGPLTFSYPLQVPNYAFTGGQIRAIIFDLPLDDPDHKQLAVDTLDFNGVQTRRAAVNGMGDLDNDGYVSDADRAIVQQFYMGARISNISPLPVWEFVRRADLNCDSNIDTGDITAIRSFIAYGTLPTPVIGSRATSGLGDLNNDGLVNNVDIKLVGLLMSGYTLAEVSPLDGAEAMRRADVNADGQINMLDVLVMLHFIDTGEWPAPPQIVYAASVEVGVVTPP